jgi:D-serine deaminase-like pyridoxal phosphate-dependent protein
MNEREARDFSTASNQRVATQKMGEREMSEGQRLHGHLIRQQGSRHLLNTPALVIDLEMLERNISEMAAFAKAHRVALRPHTKTHKSPEIARRQIAAGAIGICCAKLGEAEALSGSDISNVLVTSPVVTPQAIRRLVELSDKIADLMVVVDHPANVDTLAAAGSGKPISVIIDIDPGMHRTGVTSPGGVVELARRIEGRAPLRYRGVQYFCGREQHIVSFRQRRIEIDERTRYLKEVIEQLESAELKPAIVTGSGTGTHFIDAKLGVFTDLQVGSYVFMDQDYNACDLRGSGQQVFQQALQIDTTVISTNTPGIVTVDGGLKAMATEKGPPRVIRGAPLGASTRFMGDEHLAVIVSPGEAAPDLGEKVVLVPPHCDPTVNLYESYHVVKGDTLVDIWPIAARGCSA